MAIAGELMAEKISEFVQIITTGNHLGVHHYHWLQARKYQGFMTVCSKKLDKFPLFILCHTLKHVGNSNLRMRKVQKQINCSLFALAFATDLCHGLDPVTEAYDQQNMHLHYVRCMNLGKRVPFPKNITAGTLPCQ